MDKKVYVTVNADFNPDGKITPNWFEWEDGRKYPIDRVLNIQRVASLKVGGRGLRYQIRVSGKETYIWYDDTEQRWFMERK